MWIEDKVTMFNEASKPKEISNNSQQFVTGVGL